MKKIVLLAVTLSVFGSASPILAAKPVATCATIQGGTILDSASQVIKLGFDQWGYNYQANSFNGFYDNYSRPVTPATTGDLLSMKWNEAWLSSKDCNNDNKLDRASDFNAGSYRGTGAWLTNTASGTYASSTYDVTASYNVAFEYQSNIYNHDLALVEDTTTGALSGVGGYPFGGAHTYDWQITSGLVVGNTITITADYTAGADAVTPLTTMVMTGTIAPDGSMNGTWSDNYQGSPRGGNWETVSGVGTPNMCTWSDFIKIVAAPSTGVEKVDEGAGAYGEGTWVTTGGAELGPVLWGDFAVIQEVSSDPCGSNALGLMNYKSELNKGLGNR